MEARLLCFRQFGAGEPEVAYLVGDDALLFRRELREGGTFQDSLVLGEEGQILAKFGVETGNFRQLCVVGFSPCRDVIDRVQMANNTPGARQPFDAIGQRGSEIVPGGRDRVCREAFDEGSGFVQQRADGRRHVGRRDGVKAGESGKVEQGVRGH